MFVFTGHDTVPLSPTTLPPAIPYYRRTLWKGTAYLPAIHDPTILRPMIIRNLSCFLRMTVLVRLSMDLCI